MSDDRERMLRVQRLVDRAVALPESERLAWLQAEAGADPDLIAEVLDWFERARRPDSDEAHHLAAMRAASPPVEGVPTRIGPYRILGKLGEGGMGTVYLAEQERPVRRQVALKVIRIGMDSRAVVARFRQEEQALALMQHPGIAQVYDCGTTERGQPYFAMEYVSGMPLTSYCDARRLPLRERLRLIQQVCAAVTHAHQKGIVHRDLKPSNVLVAEQQDVPVVKVIDFGLAKVIGPKLFEESLQTDPGMVVGTLEYMAPEQVDQSSRDVDTRADVYSLGVMLYELLVGQLPFPAHDLRRAGLLEAQRILCQVDPPRPSLRLAGTAEAAAVAIAQTRATSGAALQRTLRDDLDWAVLKALEKDRGRRYESPSALGADLQRFLDHQPLLAGPPSAGYRLRKFLRRYRVAVAMVATVFGCASACAVFWWNGSIAEAARAGQERFLARIRMESHRLPESMRRAVARVLEDMDAYDWWRCTYTDGLLVFNNFRMERTFDVVNAYFRGQSPMPDDEAFFVRGTEVVHVRYDADGASKMIDDHGPIVSIERLTPR